MSPKPFRVALADGLRHEGVLRHRHHLDAIGATIDVLESPTSDAEAIERLSGYHGLIWPHGSYRLHSFARLPDLIGVIAGTVGVDHVDLDAATSAGVVVGHIPAFATEQTADLALYLILGAVRRIPQMLDQWRLGNRAISAWEPAIVPIGDMRDSVLALIGFGRIARAVATRAQAFGMRCLAYAPTVSEWEVRSYGVSQVSLDEAFGTADVVSVHLPLTPRTHHFISTDLLGLMKPSAVLINVARGPVVDEAALVEALRNERIAGAGIDVFEREPPAADDPLVNLPNVIWTPHAGASTSVSIERVGEGSAEQMAWLAQGLWPRHVANPGVTPRMTLERRSYPTINRS